MEQYVCCCGLNYNSFRVFCRPGFHFGAPQKHKVMTKPILYKIDWEILFQKVALGYLLHFVQNGSSKNIIKTYLLHINLKNPKVTPPGFHLGAPKARKVATKTISDKRYGEILFQKVASGYWLHFVQDGSSKNALENLCLRTNVKNPKIGEKSRSIPPHSP